MMTCAQAGDVGMDVDMDERVGIVAKLYDTLMHDNKLRRRRCVPLLTRQILLVPEM